MTDEEKQIMALSIENAMLKGFKIFAEAIDRKISHEITVHRENCPNAPSFKSFKTFDRRSFSDAVKDWRTICVGIVMIAWTISATISAVKGTPQKFTAEQVRQIAQQVQEVTNPTPVTKNR